MVYLFIKVAVGTLLMADYSLPLLIVFRRRFLWDEPMILLVANLCALNFTFGVSLSAIGLMDLIWQPPPPVLCATFMAYSVGSAVTVKLTHVFLALDQYVAISMPLHYYQRMEPLVVPLIGFSWAWATLYTAGGLAANLAGMETPAQLAARVSNATSPFTGCRWETMVPGWFMTVAEMQVFLFSVCTSSIFIYAGYVAWREKARMEAARAPSRRHRAQPEEFHFLANLSAFKRVLRLMLLVLTLDCAGSVLRLSSPWYPMPQLNGIIHQLRLSLGVAEGWVYGLQNGKMRAAYVEALGCCCGRWLRGGGGRVMPQPQELEQEQQQQQQQEEDGQGDRMAVNVIQLAAGGEPGSVDDVEGQRVTVPGTTASSDHKPAIPVTAWPAPGDQKQARWRPGENHKKVRRM